MIVFNSCALSKLAAACEKALPAEACGLLLGRAEGSDRRVTDIALPSGAAGLVDGFELADHEMARMAAYAACRGLGIVAVFHSHPTGFAGLSSYDMAAIRHSEWPWVVVTQAGGLRLTAFAAGTAQPVAVR